MECKQCLSKAIMQSGVCLSCGFRNPPLVDKAKEEEEQHRKNALTCSVTGMEFVEVPGGVFDMGDLWGDGDDSEKPVHSVRIQPFQLAKYPVTQDQWEQVMGDNPSDFSGANRPVENVSWDDAQAFIRRLNGMGEGGFRLPSEAEWEYACCSGGKRHKWSGTNSETELQSYGCSMNNSGNNTNPVGQKRPNELGLYDMSGNVFEWCEDGCHDDYEGAPANGSPWTGLGDRRIVRGGSWYYAPNWLRSALRLRFASGLRNNDIGFRLAWNRR